MSTAAPAVQIPAHVPAHLVGEYPLYLGAVTYENPFDRIVPAIHDGPEAIYSLNAYPGYQPAWIFRRMKDLQAIYMDTENFTTKDFAPFSKLLGDTWSVLPVETDPPMHGLYRNMMNPLFTPRKMALLEGRVRQLALEYIDKFKDKSSCEFMEDFAFRFPIAVFLELMGLPMSKVDDFLEWENGLLHSPDMEVIAASTRAVKDYLWSEIRKRRENPVDDLISYGVQVEIEGRKLTDDELFGFCFNLFIGGMDTVSTNMAWQFRHLAENPKDQALLRANPELIPNAVEELLRAYAAVTTFRTCTKPVKVGDVQLMPGDKVAMPTTLVNRDPDVFENPNEVHLDRNPRHITFGTGIHRCVGAPLARREMVIALEEFLKAIPEFSIAPDAKILTHLGGVMQPATLPLVWNK
ncbi:MAG: cytochrome family protein [Verrucomicrobiaceae bacterium]|nr:cytochrome family protein [Verrucomicrobiaceae bacterium]